MARQDKSFEDLVAEAPAAPSEGVVTLAGALAKSSEEGKFVLILQNRRTVTLETAAVKSHAVLGTLMGRTIVRIEIEAAKVPTFGRQPFDKPPGADTGDLDKDPTSETGALDKDPASETGPVNVETGIIDAKDPLETDLFDTPSDTKNPIETTPIGETGVETGPLQDTGLTDVTGPPDAKLAYQDASFPVWRVDTSWQDSVHQLGAYLGAPASGAGVAPFVLATPHQAPANVVAALQLRGARPFARGAAPPPIPITGRMDVNTGSADFNTGSADTGATDAQTGSTDTGAFDLLNTGSADPVTGVFDLLNGTGILDPPDTGPFDPIDTGLEDAFSVVGDGVTSPGGFVGSDTAWYHDSQGGPV